MSTDCWITIGSIITPLGETPEENLAGLRAGKPGVSVVPGSGFNKENWPLAKIAALPENDRYAALLRKCTAQLTAEFGTAIFAESSTRIILSTTKADIQALPEDTFASTWKILAEELQPANTPIVISNACISGVLAINTAADFIQSGKYENVFVIGIDILSDFVVYGFQSLFALSDEACRPFDQARKGINLGEACGTVLVSANKSQPDRFYAHYAGGSSSNDANHISGPSRTGEGLFRTVNKTLERSGIDRNQIDFISAHGTATIFNDEMESIAFGRLNLTQTPLNSLKGYFGHTLGAAGIIEVIACLFSLEHNELYSSPGFAEKGTSEALNIVTAFKQQEISTVLKTASGFGGGNASLILQKI